MTQELIEDQESQVLEQIFQEVLLISKGECHINDELLMSIQDPRFFKILSGLQMLYEDLALYKQELETKMEAEFQIEVLEKRNEELAQFNYVASHDLQEPLRTIQSFTDLLLKNNSDQLDEKGKMYLNFIKESSTRMSELIYGLLNYSKVGKSIEIEKVDCNMLVEEILKDFSSKIQRTGPMINVSQLPMVNGDKLRLRQVFQNMISNGLKFKRKGVPIELNITVDSNTQNHIFCFEDNGIGIEKNYLEKIFGIFQRLHTKSEFEGTGIGLALCKKIVEMHNGRIWVESTPGSGSKFFIVLPKN